MKSLVVYDSYFGNTEKVAQTIYETLKSSGSSKLIHVSEASDLDVDEYDLIVVGSPTRYYKPTKPIVEFVREIKSYDIHIGLFDTRMDAEGHWILGPAERLLGFAVDSMDSIVSMGVAQIAVEPLGVYVKSTEGPIAKKSFKDIETWTNLLIQAMPKTSKAKPKAKVTSKTKEPSKAKPKATAKKAPAKPAAKPKAVAKTAPAKAPVTPAAKKATPKPATKKPAVKAAPKPKSPKSNPSPVFAIDLSTGKKIDLTTMSVAQLKQFAKDNFNKGYEDLNREQLIMLNGKSAIEVKEMARVQNVKNYSKMRKSDLVKILTSSK